VRRMLRWICWSLGAIVAAFIVAAVASIRSGDASLYPPSPQEPRVEIVIAGYLYHAGIVVPREAIEQVAHRRQLPALAAIASRFSDSPRLEFGWGDHHFYTRAPTSLDVTTVMALRALFRPGNPSVMHVVGLDPSQRAAESDTHLVTLALGVDGFARLADALDASFTRHGDRIEELGPNLLGPGQFYRANGAYNVLRVCNHWVADLLHAAGVPTAPVLATLPQGLLWDLSIRGGAAPVPPANR
jgi:uncharacterized protein (TIGR02117 family)